MTLRYFIIIAKKKIMALILPVRGIEPVFGDDCYIADNATVVGEVTMGKNCSVWFNAVVRGDVHYIKIGDNTNIQDGAVIHCSYKKAPVNIGNNVSIAHNAVVHGCTVHDNVLIGMGAIVMDNAVIHSEAIVAAGAVVLANTVVVGGYIYAGTPAKKVKKVDGDWKDVFSRTANNYIKYSKWFTEDNMEY